MAPQGGVAQVQPMQQQSLFGQPGVQPFRSSLAAGSLNRQTQQAMKMKNATVFAHTQPLSKDALNNLLKMNSSRKQVKQQSGSSPNLQQMSNVNAARPISVPQM
jgi:hypothetical protein